MTTITPNGWAIDSLQNIVVTPSQDIVDGPFGSNLKASEYTEKGIPIIRLQNIDRNKFIHKNIRFITEDKAKQLERHNFISGDIAVTKLGDPVGKAAIIPPVMSRGVIVADIVRVRLDARFANTRFITYAINSPSVTRAIGAEVKGSTRPRVNLSHIRQLNISIAPLNEQKRIADKLDVLLARVDASRAHLKRVQEILKDFRQSVLAAAVSGRLTEEWREENGCSRDEWNELSGKEVFSFITSGSRGWAKYYSDSGALFIRVGNLDHKTINLVTDELQYVSLPDVAEGRRTRIEVGDILISITADVGRIVYIGEDIGEAYINQHICLARQTGDYLGAYLAYFLMSPEYGLKQFTDMQRGVTKAGLTLGDIRSLKIRIPSFEEQQEIVRRIEELFSFADSVEARTQAALSQVENLTPSLLAKAFRGELVPQDPNDEPASVLLERIRAEREAGKKKTGPKQDVKKRVTRKVKMTEDSVREIIQQLPKNSFSFDELREMFPGNYDELKDILFKLLADPNPIVTQVFDTNVRAIRFVRRAK